MIAALLSVLVVADVGCGESAHDWPDVTRALAVAENRARRRGRPILEVVTARDWNARRVGCAVNGSAHKLRARHLWLSLRAHLGALDRPAWLDAGVLWFCSLPRGGCGWHASGRRVRVYVADNGHAYWRATR